jgi:hypothetical protein
MAERIVPMADVEILTEKLGDRPFALAQVRPATARAADHGTARSRAVSSALLVAFQSTSLLL